MGMVVTFATKKLDKLCNKIGKLRGEYGPKMADLIIQRLADLKASESLEDMRVLPGKCHGLKANRKGQFAVHLIEPMRLVFAPAEPADALSDDGRLDWTRIKSVRVLEIIDYHDE